MKNIIVTDWSTCSTGDPLTVWPDGCRDLIVCIEPMQHPKIFLTGLDTTSYCVKVPTNTFFFGIRLAPGSVAVWEKGEPTSCRDLLELHQHRLFSTSLFQKISKYPEQASELLVEAVEEWFKPINSITKEFFDAINHSDGQIPLLTRSSRTLRRNIRSATGASPQFWLGLRRVRKSAYDILLSDTPLVDIALSAGYSDQAHLTREMRRWLGLTPAALRREAEKYKQMVTLPNAFSTLSVMG